MNSEPVVAIPTRASNAAQPFAERQIIQTSLRPNFAREHTLSITLLPRPSVYSMISRLVLSIGMIFFLAHFRYVPVLETDICSIFWFLFVMTAGWSSNIMDCGTGGSNRLLVDGGDCARNLRGMTPAIGSQMQPTYMRGQVRG